MNSEVECRCDNIKSLITRQKNNYFWVLDKDFSDGLHLKKL